MFEKKNKKEEATVAQAIVDISKGMKDVVDRLEKLEKQPVTEPVKPEEATPNDKIATKPEIKQKLPTYVVHDQSIKTKRIILDVSDEENPIVYDTEAAIVEVLNKLEKIDKAIG